VSGREGKIFLASRIFRPRREAGRGIPNSLPANDLRHFFSLRIFLALAARTIRRQAQLLSPQAFAAAPRNIVVYIS
jgi:hypothetical protein